MWRTAATLVAGLVLASCSVADDLHNAQIATDGFHARYNAGQYRLIYEEATDAFKKRMTAFGRGDAAAGIRLWEGFLSAHDRKYGAFQSSSQLFTDVNVNGGVTTIALSYDSTFQRGKTVERFQWIVSGAKPTLNCYLTQDLIDSSSEGVPEPLRSAVPDLLCR